MIGLPTSIERAGAETRPQRPAPSATDSRRSPLTRLWWTALVVVWLVQVPLFLAMPITNDAAIYDLQVRSLLSGGVLYRDVLEPNLPGIVWIQTLIRSTLGWSSVALRAADLAFFAVTLTFTGLHLRRAGVSAAMTLGAVLTASMFYFASSEWIHCQRDMWLLMIALGALELRARQAQRLTIGTSLSRGYCWALAEGLVWGAAVWLKPHIMIPAALAWLVTAIHVRRRPALIVDALGLLTGGLLAGGLGIGWLMSTGAWPYMLDTFREWNPRYVQAGKEHWTFPRFVSMNLRMFPWLWIHILALGGVAVLVASRFLRRRSTTAVSPSPTSKDQTCRQRLLVALYLGWTFQAFVLQHLFDYVHAPPIVLGVVVVAWLLARQPRHVWRVVATAVVILAGIFSPLFQARRLEAWPTAIREAGSPELHDRLRRLAVPDWRNLENVAVWLESQDVKQGDVMAINDGLVHLYNRLGMQTSVRFQYIEQAYFLFPEQRRMLRASIQNTPHRFAVVNLIECGFSISDAMAIRNDDPLAPPPRLETRVKGAYPWNLPIVYRAGPYLVFKADGADGRLLLPAPRRDSKSKS